jgi:hypothetical protein
MTAITISFYAPAKYRAAQSAIATGIIDQKKSASRSSAVCQVRSSRNHPQIMKVAIAIKAARKFIFVLVVNLQI